MAPKPSVKNKKSPINNIINNNHEDAKKELELDKYIDDKVPRKVTTVDGVTLGKGPSRSRYFCDICGMRNLKKSLLQRHLRSHTLERPFQCDLCEFTTSYSDQMSRHMKTIHLILPAGTKKIKKEENESDEEPNSNEVSPNKKRNVVNDRFECAICALRSTYKRDLMEHIRIKHPNAHIESLVNKDGSKVHRIVTKARKSKPSKKIEFQCEHCFLTFPDKWKYTVHLRSHTGLRPWECSICDLKATTKMTVRDHIHRKHTKAEKPMIILRTTGIHGNIEKVELPVSWEKFKCEHCNELFKDNYSLKLHRNQEHPDIMPFSCTVCNHKEKTRANMILHCQEKHEKEDISNILHKGKPIKVHSLNLPTCDVCKKVFPYKSLLATHTRLHTGAKPYPCTKCDYQTYTKDRLVKHIKKSHELDSKEKSIKSKKKKADSINKIIDSKEKKIDSKKKTTGSTNKNLKNHKKTVARKSKYICSSTVRPIVVETVEAFLESGDMDEFKE